MFERLAILATGAALALCVAIPAAQTIAALFSRIAGVL